MCAKLQDLIDSRAVGIDVLARTTSFVELADIWLNGGLPADVTENTRANFERMLRGHVFPVLGTMPVPELRSEHVEAMLDAMMHRQLSASSMRLSLNLTRRASVRDGS